MAITTNGGAGVTADAVATLTNKTLVSPIITDPTINGTTTNINTTNLVVEDKNIVINDVVSPSDTNADGGGISLSGATTKTLNWVNATSAWTSSEHLNLASGKSFYVNGTLLKDTAETLTNKTLTNPVMNNFVLGYTTTATAAGTTVLTVSSNNQQVFTGVTTQTVTMPVASTMTVGTRFVIENNSTGVVTVQSSGLNSIVAIPSGMSVKVLSILASGTDAASWDYEYIGYNTITGTGANVFATAPSISNLTITGTLTAGGGTGTSGQVLTSTGSGVQYTTLAAGTTANDQAFAFAVQVFA